MEITRVKPRIVKVRPRKYARIVHGVVVAEDETNWYWVDDLDNIHSFNKSNKKNWFDNIKYRAYVYVITNDINNKIYIGETTGKIEWRYINHLACVRDKNNKKPIYEDMRKFGVEHFSIEELVEIESYSPYMATTLECLFMNLLDSRFPNGYNLKSNIPFGRLETIWGNISAIHINPNSKYREIIEKFVNEEIQLQKWDKYKNFDLSPILKGE